MKNLTNDFEGVAFKYYPIVKKIKKDLLDAGAMGSLMAGAGLSVLGFFDTKVNANLAKEKLLTKYKQIYLTKTL